VVYHGPRMIKPHVFSADLDSLVVYAVSDIHYGNSMQNHKEVKRIIKEIEETENAVWIGAGDYLELNGKKQSHGGVFHDTMPPEKQMEAFVEDFSCIADKCLVLIDGNHDFRISKDWGISPTKWCAKAMGIPDEFYVEDGALVRVRLGRRTQKGRRQSSSQAYCDYSFYVTHGASASNTSAGKVSSLAKAGNAVVADVIIGAHMHSEFIFRDRMYLPHIRDNGQSSYKDRWFVNTGSFLEYGGYALTARYTPQPMGTPKIILNGSKEQVNVYL
jgi:hypothetical protein